ncbi:MAG: bifunctional 2-C-methyl-D-erythritol 4-phosphate cytidylyltransferase/2-C-methyl-D-erythritol 2,4-cyclodiphosphate synthase [Bosea sp. (in: a-proteobacteria)]
MEARCAMPPRQIAFVLVAAGRGLRAGGSEQGQLPKQYRPFAGKSSVHRCLVQALSHPAIDFVQPVVAGGDEALFADNIPTEPGLNSSRLLQPVAGAPTRQASVKAGLDALSVRGFTGLVLVHDAARPFITHALISRAIAAGGQHMAAIPALPVTDTIKQIDAGGLIIATPPREHLRSVQTPQVFDFAKLHEAHTRAAATGHDSFTDDGAVMEWAGHGVATFQGDAANIKLTTSEDFAMAEARLSSQMRMVATQGYDVHRFGPGDHVWLGGVRIAHTHGVEAHSDGDVILHALTDALLGALAEGDIGTHFPPSDPQWRGASSDQFLRFAVSRVSARGGRITHLDVTLVCEAPRIGPHRVAIQARIAQIAGLKPDQVGLKATTSEKMGFTGRHEGLAALAMASLMLPDFPMPEVSHG